MTSTSSRAGYLNNYAQHSDLRQYLELYNHKAAAAKYTFSIVSPFGEYRNTGREAPKFA